MSNAAIVLAGGFSRRMGRDKASLPWGDTTLLGHVVGVVTPLVDEVVVVVREGSPTPDVPARFAFDPAEGEGPLAGLAAGLAAITADRAFLTACDVPLLRPALVERLLAEPGDCVVPVIGARWMVTCAVYARHLADTAWRLLAEGERRPRALAIEVGATQLDEQAVRGVDPDLDSFRTCNTPDEYATLVSSRANEPDR